jgi:Ran GTPase-activating protein (RanGAP) involved in mRNA processing and transport
MHNIFLQKDIIFLVCRYLSLADICNLQTTCKNFLKVRINATNTYTIHNLTDNIKNFPKAKFKLVIKKEINTDKSTEIANILKVTKSVCELHVYPSYRRELVQCRLIFESLKTNTSMKKLTIRCNNLNRQHIEILAEALKVNKSLQIIDIRYNEIGSAGSIYLSEALKVNNTLKELHLGYVNMGAYFQTGLAEMLKVNTGLHTLFVGYNNIQVLEAHEFAEALKINTSLHTLYMCRTRITDVGAIEIVEASAVNKTLKILNMWDNDFSDNTKSLLKTVRTDLKLYL